MEENVIVAVRVRPANEKELQANDSCIWSIDPIHRSTISLSPSCLCDFVEQGKFTTFANIKFNFSIMISVRARRDMHES